MKWMFGRTAMWLFATVAAATVAFAAAQLPDGDGKKILETSCTSCHGIDGVTSMKLGKEGWEGLVSSMVSLGAQVDQKDVPVLIDYLVKNFGPADANPAGANPAAGQSAASEAETKKVLESACTSCHDLDLVSEQHLTKEEWQGVVASMIAKGASLTDKDTPALVDYLAKTYGPKQ